ncbi:hypothetical protein PSTT_02131 [Puccinia striiformis]|uniref:Uncharacterized protein n=1 Tax=Puccinia striiformis TaxID=27350 RepID=A0A2S4W171_9BASI|nr:hypothetical protein PSTT_02131 [Puccinia striiformis]
MIFLLGTGNPRWVWYHAYFDKINMTYLGRLQPFGNTLKTPTNPRNSAFGKDPRNAIRKETDQRINREAVESTAHVTSQGFMFNCLPAKRLSLCGPGYDTRSQDQFLFPAMATRPANHPVNISGAFQAIADSERNVLCRNQYGLVSTGSFFQCAGVLKDKELDFEVRLLANTVWNYS